MREVQLEKSTLMQDPENNNKSRSPSDDDDDDDEEEADGFTTHSGTQMSHTKSVTSLLAMKRDKIEKQRKQSILLANDFSVTSKKDSTVNSQRTLNMITGRTKSVVATQLV